MRGGQINITPSNIEKMPLSLRYNQNSWAFLAATGMNGFMGQIMVIFIYNLHL